LRKEPRFQAIERELTFPYGPREPLAPRLVWRIVCEEERDGGLQHLQARQRHCTWHATLARAGTHSLFLQREDLAWRQLLRSLLTALRGCVAHGISASPAQQGAAATV